MSPIVINTIIEHLLVPFVIAPFLAWIAASISSWTKKEIEARHMQALQSALENAIRYAMQQLATGGKVIDLSDDEWRERVINEAADYMERSVPDALSHFGLWGIDQLRTLLLPKLPVMTDAEALAWNNAITGLNQTEIPTQNR